jgi:protocatechuate 3,4-dioxygenase beta subunit
MRTISLLPVLLALAVASSVAQPFDALGADARGVAGQQPAQQSSQGQTQGGRQGRGGGQGGGQRGGGQGEAQGGQPARDTQTSTIPATSSITGRVLTADTGRPVKRAQVTASGSGRGVRGAVTDDQGRFSLSGLAAGSYTITASKNGFVDAVYGQRRPLQPGTPVQLLDNQQAVNIDLRLIRGGVITGRVLDEDGEPLMRALVSIQRYQYLQGNRQLISAGADQTDDRGVYRVFGLPAGDYYASVTVSGLGQNIGRGLQQLAMGAGAFAPAAGRGGRGWFGAMDVEPSGYAPTYYPGVVSAAEAGKITLGPGQEVAGIDFQIQLVPFATVAGAVGGADNNAGITVTLAPQDTNARGPIGGPAMNGRTLQDGSFSIPNVPPGRYVAIARSGGRQNDQRIGVQPVVVNGQNIGGLAITLQPEITLSGNITVESSGTPAPTDYSGFRVDAPEANPLPFAGGGPGGGRGGFGTGARAATNGTFLVPNLVPGTHYVRVTGQGLSQGLTTPTQWSLKAVLAGGADVTDTGVDLKPGENVDNITIVLTDRSASLTGTVRDASGTPAPALTVIAFSADPRYWRAQSRWIQAGRTDQTGTYHLRGLPPGDYFLVVSDSVEQGEWFDPSFLDQARNAATRITIADGDQKTQDLSAPSGGT